VEIKNEMQNARYIKIKARQTPRTTKINDYNHKKSSSFLFLNFFKKTPHPPSPNLAPF
jgi:hypothetical protein